jgi:hypothetical protein
MVDPLVRKVRLVMDSCEKCPNFAEENPYSTDGFDRMIDWVCKKANKTIQGAVEWHEVRKIEIPDWCPILAPGQV